MSTTIDSDLFKKSLYMLLDETFDKVQGIFLDKGTSFFETLATISAEEASIPVGGKCATLAAQVKHTAFYLDVLEENVRTQKFERVDWGKIWREVTAVSPQEWQTIQDELRDSYNRIKQLIADQGKWQNENEIGGAIAMIVHTAYHLGEIRQALCTLKS
ncbi:MAG: DinB family protein [Ardenticatenaceae bacterium]|nr:DinB family protein [Ardenticatenaceae bacterium]